MDIFKKQSWLSWSWTLVIFFLLSMDTSGANEYSILKVYGIDKVIHLGIFLVFGWLWGTWLKEKFKGMETLLLGSLIVLGSMYGMGMEYYQKYFTNRSFSYWDGLADAVGVCLGSWFSIKKPLWK